MDARYARQVALPGFGADAQAALAASRVLVIGAGGLGSAVIPALAAAGVGAIGIVDDDRVELSNLHRQLIHGAADVGRPKVESAAAQVAALNPATVVTPVASRLTAEIARDLFARFDLIVDGSDNFPTRYLAQDAAVLTGIPLVWGAVSQYAGQAGVSLGITYRDLFPTPPPPGSVLSCEAGGVMPTTVAVIGAIMAGEAIKLLTGVGNPLIGRVTTFDALTGRFRELEFARDTVAEPITGLIDYDAFCAGELGSRPTQEQPESIDARQLADRLALGEPLTLLDVREPWEAQVASIPGSVLIPLGELAAARLDSTIPVVVYCHLGARSARARDLLADGGFSVTHLAGGVDAWARELDPEMARY